MKNLKHSFLMIMLLSASIIITSYAANKTKSSTIEKDLCAESIDDDEVYGKIFVKNFTLEESYVEEINTKKGKSYRFSFFSRAPLDLCNDVKYAPGVSAYWSSGNIEAPLQKGIYSTNFSEKLRMKSFVFINKMGNKYRKLTAQCALIEVTHVNKDEVAGKLIAYGDDNSFLNGSFVASRCSK
ncbi:hypothetical protein [Aquimarina sp. 2201CG14-23]|uniref:hypothetical protein n=1 Tax=Aquimarina mycalae TaxID=3040073 RepID=UPI0024782C46|nr:hypothetical protein [Aquimarina sp. 2201CG14-23]MDH7445836.1 hypothetical protein [Aquimarina sp. 2201CG14-23]